MRWYWLSACSLSQKRSLSYLVERYQCTVILLHSLLQSREPHWRWEVSDSTKASLSSLLRKAFDVWLVCSAEDKKPQSPIDGAWTLGPAVLPVSKRRESQWGIGRHVRTRSDVWALPVLQWWLGSICQWVDEPQRCLYLFWFLTLNRLCL